MTLFKNDIKWTGGHGAAVENSDKTLIQANEIEQAGIESTTFEGYESLADVVDNGPFAADNRRDLWKEEGRMIDDVLESYFGNEQPDPEPEPEPEPYVTITNVEHSTYDGIHVEDVSSRGEDRDRRGRLNILKIEDGPDEGPELHEEYDLAILRNTVSITGDDGVEVDGAGRTLIRKNTIVASGFGAGEDYDAGDEYGADNIHVRNVSAQYGNERGSRSRGHRSEGPDVVIVRNILGVAADDGIEVINERKEKDDDRGRGRDGITASASFQTVESGRRGGKRNRPQGSAYIARNLVASVGGDGITTENVRDTEVVRNVVLLTGEDGVSIQNGATTDIRKNLVLGTGRTGISVDNVGSRGGKRGRRGNDAVNIRGNIVALNGHHGIAVTDSGPTEIKNNKVFFAGLGRNFQKVIGFANGFISEIATGGYDRSERSLSSLDVERNLIGSPESEDRIIGWRFGHGHGIYVDNVNFPESKGSKGRFNNNDWAVNIHNNKVGWTGGHNIAVSNSDATRIVKNNVKRSGVRFVGFNPYSESESPFIIRQYGYDGINVSNIQPRDRFVRRGEDRVTAEFDSEYMSYPYYGPRRPDVLVRGNVVKKAGDDGIEISTGGLKQGPPPRNMQQLSFGMYEGSSDRPLRPLRVRVVGNNVYDSQDNGIVLNAGKSAQQAIPLVSGLASAQSNFMTGYPYPVGPSRPMNSVILGNTVENSGENGLLVAGANHRQCESCRKHIYEQRYWSTVPKRSRRYF